VSDGDGYRISSDEAEIDVDAVHAFLRMSYWSTGVPRSIVEKAIRGSLCFSVFQGSAQVGFARAITDRATFAYLADVYVLPEHRGRGLGHRLVEAVLAHPDLARVRRFVLVTRDAHAIYADVGFTPLADPTRYMEKTGDTKLLWADLT
jgi:GNAT superfamily N-acetyltransferase